MDNVELVARHNGWGCGCSWGNHSGLGDKQELHEKRLLPRASCYLGGRGRKISLRMQNVPTVQFLVCNFYVIITRERLQGWPFFLPPV